MPGLGNKNYVFLVVVLFLAFLLYKFSMKQSQGFVSQQGEYPDSVSAANTRVPNSLPFPGV